MESLSACCGGLCVDPPRANFTRGRIGRLFHQAAYADTDSSTRSSKRFTWHSAAIVRSQDMLDDAAAQVICMLVQVMAEALHVRHEGKKDLCVWTDSLEPAAWPQLVSQFSAQIRDNSDPVLYETLLCDFSTTTPTIRTANEVALMDAYQRYFRYIMMCVCGIPTITLEGTPSDWQRIRDRIELLATFGLEWWTSRLAPILDESVATANGAPDLSFWQAIYKPERAYATEMATGWIADLFPYLANASNRTRNPMLDLKRTDWLPPEPTDQRFRSGVSLETIPCGLSRAPLTLSFPNKPSVELDLLGGFVGVSQSEQDLSLAPIISWAVVERDTRMTQPFVPRNPPAITQRR